MTNFDGHRKRVASAGAALLFCVFFLITCGLGYPVLNRFNPRQTPGLSDVKTYASLVTGASDFDAGDMRFRRFRVLVPWLARPFYRLARGRIGTWDPAMFGLLIADSLFVAGTATLIVVLGGILANRKRVPPAVGLVGALLYLANFAVPNLRLVGLVDAGEGFFLLALLWSLSERKLWAVPLIAAFGALTKESFVPLSIALASAWWFSTRLDSEDESNRACKYFSPQAAWIALSWVLGFGAIVALQSSITGRLMNPLQFGLSLHRAGGYNFASSLRDRNLIYIFLWLLPSAIVSLKHFPKSWLVSVGATCAMTIALDGFFGPAPGTLGRTLFSAAGPLLSLSSAIFLLRISAPLSSPAP